MRFQLINQENFLGDCEIFRNLWITFVQALSLYAPDVSCQGHGAPQQELAGDGGEPVAGAGPGPVQQVEGEVGHQVQEDAEAEPEAGPEAGQQPPRVHAVWRSLYYPWASSRPVSMLDTVTMLIVCVGRGELECTHDSNLQHWSPRCTVHARLLPNSKDVLHAVRLMEERS